MNEHDSTRPAVSRRAFLKKGATAAAAVTVATAAHGQEDATSVRAEHRIRIGMIGVGKMGGGHLGNLLYNPGVQVVAICDVETERIQRSVERVENHYRPRLGRHFGGCQSYRDFRDLCAREDIDAVVISTPNHWHAIQTIEAAQHGKDIYLEKPLARTIGECIATRTAVRRYGRVLQVGSQQRSDRSFRFACEMVRNGRIGEVQEVFVNIGGPPVECHLPAEPVPEGLDWDMWLGPAPWRPYHSDIAPGIDYGGWPNWRIYRDYAGGMMTDFGTHHFDIAQWGLGTDHTGPVEVHPPGGGRDRLTYLYENGVRMYRGGGKEGFAVEFVGTKGRVRVNRGQRLETEPAHLADTPTLPEDVNLYHSPDHMQDWLDCIRTRKDPICTVEIGTRTATIAHIGNIAYWLNRSLKWDPEAERFIGDEEANRLLSRPMRAPWRLDI